MLFDRDAAPRVLTEEQEEQIHEQAMKILEEIGTDVLHEGARKVLSEAGVKVVSLDELLAQADFVSIHCPLNEQTRNLISTRELALMKPTAYLINTARGALVDTPALAAALRAGRIAGAALDVFTEEPLPAEHNPFVGLDNVVLTPHIGAVTREAAARSRAMPVDNIIAFLEGRAEHVVA